MLVSNFLLSMDIYNSSAITSYSIINLFISLAILSVFVVNVIVTVWCISYLMLWLKMSHPLKPIKIKRTRKKKWRNEINEKGVIKERSFRNRKAKCSFLGTTYRVACRMPSKNHNKFTNCVTGRCANSQTWKMFNGSSSSMSRTSKRFHLSA